MARTTKPKTPATPGFAIEINDDHGVGLAILVAGFGDGNDQPVGVVINEARKIADSHMGGRCATSRRVGRRTATLVPVTPPSRAYRQPLFTAPTARRYGMSRSAFSFFVMLPLFVCIAVSCWRTSVYISAMDATLWRNPCR
jgi:hypothetical protein